MRYTTIFCLLFISSALWAQGFDTTEYRLSVADSNHLVLKAKHSKREYVIPLDMLLPPAEKREEGFSDFTVDAFGSIAGAFPLDKEKVGIQIYAADSYGLKWTDRRDMFIILDTVKGELVWNATSFGITQSHYRDAGYYGARSAHFFLGDVNRDGYTDIGMYRETLRLEGADEGEGRDRTYALTFYDNAPLSWYIFDGIRWEYRQQFDKQLPIPFDELPVIGFSMPSVDWVKKMYRERH